MPDCCWPTSNRDMTTRVPGAFLIYYTPFDKKEVNEEKHAFVERIGDECRANDIPYFLEFVGYDPEGGDEKSVEFAKKKPQIVMQSMAQFTQDRYGVDVMKVEVP